MKPRDSGVASGVVAALCAVALLLGATTRARAQGDTSGALPGDGEGPGRLAPMSAEEEAEIAAELGQIQRPQGPEAQDQGSATAAPSVQSFASSRGLSNLLNPAVSASGLFLAGYSSRRRDIAGVTSQPPDRGDLVSGLHLQEVELQVSAVVDPYLRADLTLTAGEQGIEFEQAYLTTLEIPHVTLRAGEMYADFGRHNILHTHAFPFLTAPLPLRAILGPEGLRDPGVSADILLPLPFYTEVNVQVFQGEWAPFEGSVPDDPATPLDESVPDQRVPEDLVYLGHVKALFELGDPSTVELGGTYAGGRNGFGGWTHLVGANVTLKWRPLEAERYTSFDWTSEYIWERRGEAPDHRSVGGLYTGVRYQFGQRWWVQARGALLGLPRGASAWTVRAEALVAFVPSEFSALRLQYAFQRETAAGGPSVHEVFLQTIFAIGSHPAHAY